ncbi:dihydrofolate reductase family protein [Propionibacteriaceae bacterium Y1685]|uniref:dihydrofolate reductase family protein n=1 Tax=Microlunatus sp. Y1700 TaxID=3418487 RepID=UPI003B7D4473
MRRVIVSEILSLDGHFTGPNGDVMAMPFDHGFSEHNAALLQTAGTLLLGARSYREFTAHWPGVRDDHDQPALEREMSERYWTIEKVVVSDSITVADTEPWPDTTRIVPRADSRAAVAALRAEEGADIVIFGSHLLWNDLFAAGLVDEFHLMIGPGIVGTQGVPAFSAAGPHRFGLIDVHRPEGSDLVRLRYAVHRGA